MSKIINLATRNKNNYKIQMVHGAKHYALKIPFEIKTGRGIYFCDIRRDNPNQYDYIVTLKAFDKLSNEYPIFHEVFADEIQLNTRLLDRIEREKQRRKMEIKE